MKFNLFSSRVQHLANVGDAADQAVGAPTIFLSTFPLTLPAKNAEYLALTDVLHQLLQTLPQAYNGRENLKRVCQIISTATSHLRLIWMGACEDGMTSGIEPIAVMGRALTEARSWQLAEECFDYIVPYVQTTNWGAQTEMGFHTLFSPWQSNASTCSAAAALAIPLRSEKVGMRGMIVFYADHPAYFAEMGFSAFQAFGHVCEAIWKQSNLSHLLTWQAQRDSLTGLLNRHGIVSKFEEAVAEAVNMEQPLSILFCRLDNFDRINEVCGWVVADRILAAFAHDTGMQMRVLDSGGRWGSVEFLYVLPATDMVDAENLASTFLQHFKRYPVHAENWSICLPLSIGTASFGIDGKGLDELIYYATQHLYSDVTVTKSFG